MRQTSRILYLSLIVLGSLLWTSAEVTHEDIRETLLPLIISNNPLDSKLERHEHRERALELMKKAMQTLQKGQENSEPISGILSRLDKRVSQIETMLMNQEQIKNMMVQQLEKITDNVDKLLASSKDIIQQTEVAFKNAQNTAEMLNKIEDKFVSYIVVTPAIEPANNKEFESKVLQNFENLNTGLSQLQTLSDKNEHLTSADKEYIQSLTNQTFNALETVKEATINAAEKARGETEMALKDNFALIDKSLIGVREDTSASKQLLVHFNCEMNATYTKLNDAVEVFNKFNNILMTNSEAVLDTQRKVEFGTISIVQKIGPLLEKQREDILNLAKKRFDNVDKSIVTTQLEAMHNMSALIKSEISSMLHQIYPYADRNYHG